MAKSDVSSPFDTQSRPHDVDRVSQHQIVFDQHITRLVLRLTVFSDEQRIGSAETALHQYIPGTVIDSQNVIVVAVMQDVVAQGDAADDILPAGIPTKILDLNDEGPGTRTAVRDVDPASVIPLP